MEESKSCFRITFNSGTKIVCFKDAIKFQKIFNQNYKNILDYYQKIARLKDEKKRIEVGDYLERQLKNIIVDKNNSLMHFFNGESDVLENQEITIYPFGINLSQREAIRGSLIHQFSLIQGPPGTGKTQSILNIIANLIIRDKTIAVVSSNNEAIKNIIEKLDGHGYSFLSAFLGNSKNKKMFFENQPEYPVAMRDWGRSDEEIATLKQSILELEDRLIKLLEYKNEYAILAEKLREYKHEQDFFKEYAKTQSIEKLNKLEFFNLNDEEILDLLVDFKYDDMSSMGLLKKIKYLFKYGIYDYRQFEKIEDIIVDLQEKYYDSRIDKLNYRLNEINTYLSNEEYEKILEKLGLKSKEYFNAILAKKYLKNIKRPNFSLKTFFYNEEFKSFISEYPIIVSTTHAISKSKNRSYIFDYLIVDEASQVELVPGIIALSAAENAVIVGDLRQLPHIPCEKLKAKEYDEMQKTYKINEPYNYYSQSLLSSFVNIYKDGIPNTLLKEHYRCHNRIISYCNKKYYDGELICHSKVNGGKPLILIRTAKGNHMRYGKNATNKITNIRELESIIDAEFLKEAGLDLEKEKSLGFMAPFRGQVNESKKILAEDFQKDTVHKFQGRECDVVVFSTVLDTKKSAERLMSFVDEPHLINVAVSRAKEKFVLVSSVDIFKNRKGEINDLIRYIEYYEEDSILFQSNVRSVFDLLYDDYKEELNKKKANSFFNKSKYDSENLLAEVLDSLFLEEKYKQYKYAMEVPLKELIRNHCDLSLKEGKYLKRSKVDFVIYNKFDNQPVLCIEVDGYHFHENNPKQEARDAMKNNILSKYHLNLLRLPTNYSGEQEKIQKALKS